MSVGIGVRQIAFDGIGSTSYWIYFLLAMTVPEPHLLMILIQF